MKRHFKYLAYLWRHKVAVFREAWKLGIPWLGLLHDWSKFRPDEWLPYADYFYGGPYPEHVYGDARNWVRSKVDVQNEFDSAWLTHIHRNKHHHQFWTLREDSGAVKCLFMPDRYRREMLADWRGAGIAITGRDNTPTWYLANRDKMLLHPSTREWIEQQLGVPPAEQGPQ